MRVELDRSLCVCSETCVELVPDVFAVEDYKTVVRQPEPPPDRWDDVREAAELCPTAAIILTEDSGDPR